MKRRLMILLPFMMLLAVVSHLLSSCRENSDAPPSSQPDTPKTKKRVLYVDSYHPEYEWSNGITREIVRVMEQRSDVHLRVHCMDTKRHAEEAFKVNAGKRVHALIEEWKPDVVIASDDNASKYLIVPYYKGSDLPFVFCGVNWDASDYGFPAKNVTGMIEVQLIDQLIDKLKPYASRPGIGLLKGDDLSARKEAQQFEQSFAITLDTRLVSNFVEWKKEYLSLQDKVGILLLGNAASIKGWNESEAKAFVLEHSKIPSGNWDQWMAEFSLITISTTPEEQGRWAATTALKILDGQTPESIPVERNKQARIILNMKLAKAMKIVFPWDLMESAELISAAPDDGDQGETRNDER